MIFLVGNQVQGPKETRMLQPFTRYLLKEVGTPAASQNIGLQLANRQWGLKKETSELLLLLLVIQDMTGKIWETGKFGHEKAMNSRIGC